ncbi:MAG TPA: aminoglycoside phosphotransferase family protein [Chloroflexota bacterium]|nr:aminoglycoside phosphotransferase family protein [Chloroflexota bacterium]
MPDIKLQPLLEAIHPKDMKQRLEPFFGELQKPPIIDASRLHAPICYWAVYKAGDQRVTLKSFFSEEEYESYLGKLRKYYEDRFDQPQHPLGGLMLIPELNGLLWGFPFDPQMPQLHRCTDVTWINDLLERRSSSPLQPKIITYNPEINAILAYRDQHRILAYGKASANDDGEQIFDIMDRLWWSTERAAGQLRVARPLAYASEANLLLQSAVGGRVMPGRRNSKTFLELVKVAGSALALIHGSDITHSWQRTLQFDLRRLHSWIHELELTSPGLYSTMRLLLDQVDSRAKQPESLDLVPSHGDYKWNQFLHYRGRFSLIDFELFCESERWFDVGYFCAYLPSMLPDDWRDGMATELLRERFLSTYSEAAGVALDLERIGLYEAAALATRAITQVWQHQGNWHYRASLLLDMAVDRLVSPEPKQLDISLAAAL